MNDAEPIAKLLNRFTRDGSRTIMDEPLTVADQLAYMESYPDFHLACGNGELAGAVSRSIGARWNGPSAPGAL